MSLYTLKNFINGEFCEAQGGQTLDHYSPKTGKKDGVVPRSQKADIDLAVQSAKAAFPKWRDLTQKERCLQLFRIAEGIEKRAHALAEAESLDQGKPIQLALDMDIRRSIDNFRYFAGHMLHRHEKSLPVEQGFVQYTSREPLGVAGLISPWNLPLYLLTWKIAPALATGNTAVCKPSEFTSRTAFMLAEIFQEAGLPPGVCNMVMGLGAEAGQALVDHPDVPLISFTGGTETGKKVAVSAAPHFKKTSLELGGKNATLIFEQSNWRENMATIVRSAFLNQGEICLCGSRIFVEKSIFEEFKIIFKAEVEKLKVGDPESLETFLGPLVSKQHFDKVNEFIALAKKEGELLTGGEACAHLPESYREGFFIQPVVAYGVPLDSRLMKEEVFGPFVTLHPFKTVDEAIKLANSTDYGLSATVWSIRLDTAHHVAHRLHAGTVWVNTWLYRDLRMPFGGVKKSGVGREGADYSVDFFTELKSICIRLEELK